jgi:hypothetical protein
VTTSSLPALQRTTPLCSTTLLRKHRRRYESCGKTRTEEGGGGRARSRPLVSVSVLLLCRSGFVRCPLFYSPWLGVAGGWCWRTQLLHELRNAKHRNKTASWLPLLFLAHPS